MKRVGLIVGVVVLLAAASVAGALVLPPHLRHLRLPRLFGAPKPVLVSVPVITTNLAGSSSANFAQIAFTVKLTDAAVALVFTRRQAAVRDAVIADMRQESLAALGGARGMSILSGMITSSLDGVLGEPKAVLAVFFTQFVVQ